MKKIMIAVLFSIAIAFSGSVGFASTVRSNMDKFQYSFYNGYVSGNIEGKDKNTNKRLYVRPVSGPTLKYTVQGSTTGKHWTNRSCIIQ